MLLLLRADRISINDLLKMQGSHRIPQLSGASPVLSFPQHIKLDWFCFLILVM